MRRVCVECGRAFDCGKGAAKYCSPECYRKKHPYDDVKPKMKERAQKKPKFSLREVAMMARREGISYGEFVSKYGL